jgi:hypothetical protein
VRNRPDITSVEGRRYDRDLGRHEARRQPPADDRPLFHWFARDECLKDGADTCARGVTVAAFFNRPRAVDDADDHASNLAKAWRLRSWCKTGDVLSRIRSRMAPSAATTVGIYTLSGEPHMNGRSFRARWTSSVRSGIYSSARGRAVHRCRHGLAIRRAHRFARLTRALTGPMRRPDPTLFPVSPS